MGSFIEEYTNKVQLVQRNVEQGTLERIGEFDHPYSATKIMWSPESDAATDLLATTGDYLRIWNVNSETPDGVELKSLLNNVRR